MGQGADNPLRDVHDVVEQPFIKERSLSDVHDEPRVLGEPVLRRALLDALLRHCSRADRFNRFLIIFGYENGGFLAPPYPYFFDTPGFPDVHMVGPHARSSSAATSPR